MSLESKNYIATPADIAAMAKAYGAALDTGGAVRAHYLRALVATTQYELGAKPRQRTAGDIEPTLDRDTVQKHLTALETVHEKFYAVVLENINGNADERNRRSNFARSAVSTVRAFVRTGRDITLLAAARLTKAALAVEAVRRRRPPSLDVLRKRATRVMDALSTIGDQLIKADRAMAVEVLEAAIAKLSARLASVAGKPTTDAKRAVREHLPLKTRAGTFYPAAAA